MFIPIRAWHIHQDSRIRVEVASWADPTYRDRVERAEQQKMDFYTKEVEQMDHARRSEIPIPGADETLANPEIPAVPSCVIPSSSIPVQISPGASSRGGSRPMAIEHLQCRAPRCRRMMMEGLLPRPSADAIADADDLDRKKGLTKCTKARFIV